jgi:hypothetical protein
MVGQTLLNPFPMYLSVVAGVLWLDAGDGLGLLAKEALVLTQTSHE